MNRYALINEKTGVVENIILWDGVSDYVPAEGCVLVPETEEHRKMFSEIEVKHD